MQKLSKKNKGLSTVITTLIILVVAVLLAGVVTYYATNVVMTRTTQEEVRIRKPHVWVDEGDDAYAALMVQNLGGRDVLIDKVTIRGVDCPWGTKLLSVGETIAEQEPLGSLTVFGGNFAKLPIVPETITITAIVSGADVTITDTPGVLPDGTLAGNLVTGIINYETGAWTLDWGVNPGPDAGTPITAVYTYTAVMVKYYIVSAGEDVSDDFKLKEDAISGAVYAHINDLPASATGWLTPTTDIPLKSSGSILFFITDPTNIALHDVGTTISLTVFTSNAQWIIETNVQAADIEPAP